MGLADCLQHMAWEAGVHLDCARIVLGFVLLLLLLLHLILQTAVGCGYTLVDIGVALRVGRSVWGLVR